MSVRQAEPCHEAIAERALPVGRRPQLETGTSNRLSEVLALGRAQLHAGSKTPSPSAPPTSATPAMLREEGLFDTGMSWIQREENTETVRVNAMKQVRDAAMSAAELRHGSGTGGDYEAARQVAITRFNDYRTNYWCGEVDTSKDAAAMMQVGDAELERLYDGYEADVYKNVTGIDINKLDLAAQPVANPPEATEGTRGFMEESFMQALQEMSVEGNRVAVKLMGGKTVPMNKTRSEEDIKRAWEKTSWQLRNDFEEYYKHLQARFPAGTRFDFFTDGDPPEKEDEWKLFTAYASGKGGNTLTITRKDDKNVQKKIDAWKEKDVPFVNVAFAPDPRKFTLAKTEAVVVLNITPTTTVFDATMYPDPMLDGNNFQNFQIKNGHWVATDVPNSNRLILKPEGLGDTEIMAREDMKVYLANMGVGDILVKSQGQTELDEDVTTYTAIPFDNKFAVYMKPQHHSEQTAGIPGGALFMSGVRGLTNMTKTIGDSQYKKWCARMLKLAKTQWESGHNREEYNELLEIYREMVNSHKNQGSDNGNNASHRDSLLPGENTEENFRNLLETKYKNGKFCATITKPSEIKSSAADDEDVGGIELCCDEEDTGGFPDEAQAFFESKMHGKNTSNKNGLCEKKLGNYDRSQREIDDKCFHTQQAMRQSKERMKDFKRAARTYVLNGSGDNFNAAFTAYKGLRQSYFGENDGSFTPEEYRTKFDEIIKQFETDKDVGALKFKDPTMTLTSIPSVNLEEVFAQEAATGCGFNRWTNMQYPCGFVVTEFANDGTYTFYCISGKAETQYLDHGQWLEELGKEKQRESMAEVVGMLQTLLDGSPNYHRVIMPKPRPAPPEPEPVLPSNVLEYLQNYLGVKINDDEQVQERLNEGQLNNATRYVIPFNSDQGGFASSDESRIEEVQEELEDRKQQLLLTYKPPQDETPAPGPDRFAAAPDSPYNDLNHTPQFLLTQKQPQ